MLSKKEKGKKITCIVKDAALRTHLFHSHFAFGLATLDPICPIFILMPGLPWFLYLMSAVLINVRLYFQNEEQGGLDKYLVTLCKQLMGNLQDGNCTLLYREHDGKLQFDSVGINGKGTLLFTHSLGKVDWVGFLQSSIMCSHFCYSKGHSCHAAFWRNH